MSLPTCTSCGRTLPPARSGGDDTAFTNTPRHCGSWPCVCSNEAYTNSLERWDGESYAVYMRRIDRESPAPSAALSR